MSSILREISEWSTSLPYWEQVVLERIVAGATFTDETYDELLQYLLEDAGLAEQPSARPDLHFPKVSQEEDVEVHNAIRLKQIANLHNINALVPDQVLDFNDQLTIIFGSNGSGKSGYARVIASAAFTRGDKQILRDISKPNDDTDPICADLVLELDGESIPIHHVIGQVCPEMGSFYVFDSTSVRAHLTRSNPMSFSPAGLEYLTRLAEVTDGVRRRLQLRIDQLNCANPFPLRFTGGETEVTRLINSLGSQTDLAKVRQLGSLSMDEVLRIQTLDRDIARLKSANIPEQIGDLEQTISDLDLLTKSLESLGEILNDEHVERIHQFITDWQVANQLVKEMDIDQSRISGFTHIGSQVWYDFVLAAHLLAQAETIGELPYPGPESHCLLCDQPLGAEARDLLHRLWAFLESDAQARLGQANQTIESCSEELRKLDFDLLDDQAVSYRHLQVQDPQTLEYAQGFISALKGRRDALRLSIEKHNPIEISPLPQNCVREINRIIGRLSARRDELVGQNVEAEIQRLAQEKLELEHRQLLAEILEDVTQFIENAHWIEIASSPRVKRSTAHISRKYNELFDRLVTQEYIRLFQDTLEKLNCPLSIRIDTHAQKGTTIKQIALQTDASVPSDQAPPEKVLSEGEQRAVALADFFTEVRLDKQSCGVVLDDPVTSLDFEWKGTIASYVIEEATRQQVIVFTHDLHFLYLLKEKAEQANLQIQSHWVERRDEKPGWIFLNNSPLSEKEYKTSRIPREIYELANDPKLPPEEQQRLLAEGFGALRTCYEAFVMFDLFNGVIHRFEERTSIDRLRQVVIDPAIRDIAVTKMAFLSRFITGHLHSDQFAAQKPTLEMLLIEISDFEELKQRHRDFKKSQGC